MSEEQLKAFLEKVKADTSLQEKLKAAADTNTVAAIAKEAGFSISADDLTKLTKAQSKLSDQELEGVAGGLWIPILDFDFMPSYICWPIGWLVVEQLASKELLLFYIILEISNPFFS